MKYILSFLVAITLLPAAHAQMGLNSPVGLPPRQDVEIYTRNVFLVQQKYRFTTADPNASVNTLSCAASPPLLTAQTGILKDPGGDSNYSASQICTQTVLGSGSVSGYEVVFEDLDTEATNDRVIITDGNSNALVFSGSALPALFFVTGNYFSVRIEANSNGTVGRGFRLRWRAVFYDTSSPTTPVSAFGNALQFDANKGALMSGYLKTGTVPAVGLYSTALGYLNTASNYSSTALGFQNTASGAYSTALGYFNTVRGYASTAMGYGNTASGEYSTALGYRVSTNGQAGTFGIGDSDPLNQGVTPVGSPDQYVARFLNGYYLMTTGNTNPGGGTFGTVRTGVQIGRGQNSWASISDSTKKERFQPINPADLLRKIGGMKLTTWNYKGQQSIRHYGPVAQDFFAAFGHDGLGQVGCDTLIYSHDFAGVTFAGVQALIKENEQLKRELAKINAQLNDNTARLEAIEALLVPRWRGSVAVRKQLLAFISIFC